MIRTKSNFVWTGAIVFVFMLYQTAAYNELVKKMSLDSFLYHFLLPGLVTAILEKDNGL